MEIQLLDKKRIIKIKEFINSETSQLLTCDFHIDEIDVFFQNQKKRLTYTACHHDQIIGIISFDISQSQICLLATCKNDSDYKTAKELLNVIEKLAVDKICVQAEKNSLDFYKNNGFLLLDTCLIKKMEIKQKFNSYEDVYDFINSQKSRVYSLNNFQSFMNEMKNPQWALDCVHIGGTNGKGSTTNYIKEVLKKEGYQVGTFTSPALVKRLDIVRINDVNIDEQIIVDLANRYVDMWLKYEISLFEIEVFIAIMYFLTKGVDIAIFEVGLGGNLDATNIIRPLVAVNTNIGLDHTDFLGDSYESIAKAKAGIIKDGVDFITGEHKQECLDIFRDECEKHHSQLMRVDRIHDIQDGENVKYCYRDYNIVLNTPALYQIQNSALAIETLLYLRNHKGIDFDDENMIYGLFEAKWAGRFEKLCNQPLIIIDGAHNREGVDELYRAAKKFHDLKIIFSALKDKDTDYMIERLLDLTYDITICEFEHPRRQKAELLAKDYPVKVEPDYIKVIDEAFDYQGTILITGSLYFISKIRPYIQQKIKNNEKQAEQI